MGDSYAPDTFPRPACTLLVLRCHLCSDGAAGNINTRYNTHMEDRFNWTIPNHGCISYFHYPNIFFFFYLGEGSGTSAVLDREKQFFIFLMCRIREQDEEGKQRGRNWATVYGGKWVGCLLVVLRVCLVQFYSKAYSKEISFNTRYVLEKHQPFLYSKEYQF